MVIICGFEFFPLWVQSELWKKKRKGKTNQIHTICIRIHTEWIETQIMFIADTNQSRIHLFDSSITPQIFVSKLRDDHYFNSLC